MGQKNIKMISWNVNGLRAVMKKDFHKSLKNMDADIVALQETKIQEPQLTEEMKNIEAMNHTGLFPLSRKDTAVSGFIQG